MVMYLFQCYSLKSSHPLILPLSPKVCSLCLCLLCWPACRIISTIFLDSIYTCLIYDICLSLSDLLHSVIIGYRFIHLIRTDSNAFLFIDEWYFIVYVYHNFLIHSSADRHLGCFYVLAIVNSAAMNIGVHVSFSILLFSGYMPSIRWIYAQFIQFYSWFLKQSPHCFP